MGILTVRLSAEEERVLERRSRGAGMKKASFVRQLIREQPLETAGDAWQAAVASQMQAILIGSGRAFESLGAGYESYR